MDAELAVFRALIVAAANRHLEAIKANERYDPKIKELQAEAAELKTKGELLAAGRKERTAYDKAVAAVTHDPDLRGSK